MYAKIEATAQKLWHIAVARPMTASRMRREGTLFASLNTRRSRADRSAVKAADPESTDEQLKTWMGKVLKLKSTAYAKPDDDVEGLELRFKVTLVDDKGTRETLEFLRKPGDDKGNWWGRSAHTRGLVKLLRGPTSSLADDVETLVAE